MINPREKNNQIAFISQIH